MTADSESDFVAITHDPSGGNYDAVDDAELTVLIADDDSPNFDLSKSSITVAEDATTDPEFTVKLTTQPTAEVTVAVTSSRTGVVTVTQGGTLTFTTGNWNSAQTVKIRPVHDDDAQDDGAQIILTGSGGGYLGISGSVAVTVDDDETAGFVISPSPLTVGEAGAADFTVKLASQPTAGVTVTVTSGDTGAATIAQGSSLSFNSNNWSTEQTVRVRGVDDPDSDTETFNISLSASGGDYTNVTGFLLVTVTDDDIPNLAINPTTLQVDENGSRTFTVRLTTLPTDDVTVTVTSEDTDIATVSDGSLDFTTSTWDSLQTITVRGVHDADGSNETVSISLSAAGGDYEGKTGSVAVSVIDDENVAIVLNRGTLPVTEGSDATFKVKLATEPTANVTVTVTSGDTGAAVVTQGGSLLFNTNNWQDEQTVTVRAEEDSDSDNEAVTISLSGAGGDYEGETASVVVSITDNDVPNLDINPPALTVGENSTDTFTVRLTTQPAAQVTVTVTSGDTSIATVSDNSLTFTTSDWNTERTITVRGVNDADARNETVNINLAASGADYAGISGSVGVSVTDDETAELVVQPRALPVDEGGTGAFTVRLTAEPTVNVTVTVVSDDAGAASLSRGALTFNRGNWNTGQTITVTGEQDGDSREESVNVTLSATGGEYGGESATVLVTVTDDEAPVPNLVLSPTRLNITEGGSGAFTLRLATQPTASVTVSVESGRTGKATVSPSSVSFSASNWNNARTVTVSAREDSDASNDSVNINLLASGGDYAGRSGIVAVSVTDNDTAEPHLVIDPIEIKVREGGTSGFTVRLATQPTSDVTVAVASGDTGSVTVSPASVPFSQGNWQTARTVTVRGEQDSDSGNEAVRVTLRASGGDYEGRSGRVSVDVIDDEPSPPMLVVSPITLNITEGDAASFTVNLARQPSDTVTVYVLLYDHHLATLSDDTLTFTTSTWAAPQTVTVTTKEDADTVYNGTTISLRARGGGMDNELGFVFTNIHDNDTPGIELNQDSLTVSEEGAGAFSVTLAAQPAQDVTIGVSSDDTSVATVSPASLTFTTSDWNRAKTVTVSGEADVDSHDESATVTLSVSSSGDDYAGLSAELAVAVRDNDGEISVSFGSASYEATEGGADATVVVELSRAYDRDVTFPLSLWVPADYTRPSDYSGVPQSVSVSAGQTRASFTVTATDDVVSDEYNNRVNLSLRNIPSGFVAGTHTETVVNLIDNDVSQGVPILSIRSASAQEGEDIVFTIGIERPTDQFVLLFGWTKDITAINNTDYTAPTHDGIVIQVGWGLTGTEIRLGTIEDSVAETDETFELGLRSSGAYELRAPNKVIGTILDDDGQP